jgi:1,4-dihydroxy-2-naphthoate octaprenyltransferase
MPRPVGRVPKRFMAGRSPCTSDARAGRQRLMSPSSGSAAPISRRRAWLLAARPKTLPAAIAPVIVGAAAAAGAGAFALAPALAALIGALLLQIGVNLANDYFDFRSGIDAPDRGPVRVTQSG